MGKSNNSGCKIDPIQLALLGTFITLAGDFIAFLAAFAAAQAENCGANDKQQSQVNPKKVYTENKINELEFEIYKLRKEIDNFND